MKISQGDQYGIPIICKIDGQPAKPDLFSNVEIVIGNIRKDYNSGVIYSELEDAWIFPLTQEESIRLNATNQKAQARFKFISGNIQCVQLGEINVGASISKVVL